MKHKIKVAVVVAATLLVLALAASIFVPLVNFHGRECLYCGEQSNVIRILGGKVWQSKRAGTYHDRLTLPDHAHKMTDTCGSRIWMFRSDEYWDTFGWAARSYREALVAGIAAYPERKAAILTEYFEIDPSDDDSQDHFIKRYQIKKTGRGVKNQLDSRKPEDEK